MSLAYLAQRVTQKTVDSHDIRAVLAAWLAQLDAELADGQFGDTSVLWRERQLSDASWACLLRIDDGTALSTVSVLLTPARSCLRLEVHDTGANAGQVVPVHPAIGCAAQVLPLFPRRPREEGVLDAARVLVATDGANESQAARIREALVRQFEGMADVLVVSTEAAYEFAQTADLRLTVRAGAVLVDLGERTPRRWVTYPSAIAARDPNGLARRIQRDLISVLAAVPPPPGLAVAIADLLKDPEGHEVLDELASREQELVSEISELRQRLEVVEFDFALAVEESARLEADLNESNTKVRRLARQAWRNRMFDFDEPEPDEEDLEIVSCAELLDYLPELLQSLKVTASPEPAQRLDDHPGRELWARRALRLLRGLNDFATLARQGEFTGGLMAYCQNAPDRGIGLPPKSLALRESEPTESNPDLMRARVFRVPETVDPAGAVCMPAHLKISNGTPAPRVHFFDDSRGTTGLVYVGYFGPHLPTADGR